MAKLLEFTSEQLAHMSSEEKRRVKRMVYQRSFQERVIELRKKHGITSFVKLPQSDLPRLSATKPPPALLQASKEASEALTQDCRLAFGTDAQFPYPYWEAFILAYAMYNVFCSPPKIGKARHDPLNTQWLKRMSGLYLHAEKLLKEGKAKEARELLDTYERDIYLSENVRIRTDFREITIRLWPGFSAIKEIQPAIKTIKMYLNHFREKEYGSEKDDMLDVLNDIAAYSDGGMNTRQITQKLEEDDRYAMPKKRGKESPRRYDEASVRSMLRRARELGF